MAKKQILIDIIDDADEGKELVIVVTASPGLSKEKIMQVLAFCSDVAESEHPKKSNDADRN